VRQARRRGAAEILAGKHEAALSACVAEEPGDFPDMQTAQPLLMLSGIAAVGCGFAGYASGLDPLRTRLPVFITAFLVCSVIFVILDLDRPNVGFIIISQQPLIDTLASLSALSD
jgi:hypothetical protein